MTTKRLFPHITIILSVVATTLTGCSETIFDSHELMPGDALTATIASDNGATTRTVMIDNPGQKVALTWKAGDRIGISPEGGGQNMAFSTTEADISNGGRTASFKTVSNIPDGRLMAYYPYDAEAKTDGGTLTLSMSHNQSYAAVNNVAEPDATAFAMAGKGTKTGGIVLHNLFTLLKIGYRAQDSLVINEVRFRDLSNAAVSGTYRVTWDNDEPTAEFTGTASSDLLLTLDCGRGVLIPSGQAKVFFLVVPARHYQKGFEITLVTDGGEQIVKTIGKTNGKTLQRNLVYPIGDVLEKLDMSDISYSLQPQTHMIDNNNIDQILEAKVRSSRDVIDDAGSEAPLITYEFLVDRAMNLKVDDYLVINQPSEMFPQGFSGKVLSAYNSADNTFATIEQLENPFAPFKEVVIGKSIYDEEGNENEDAGIDLDLSSYLKQIKTDDGQEVPFTVEGGRILLDEQTTRAIIAKKFELPELSIQVASSGDGTIKAGFQLELTTKSSLGYFDGSLDYFHFNVYPRLNMKADFTLEKKAEVSKSTHLITLVFTPIGVPPVLITPEIDISAYITLSGSISLTGTLKYRADWGSYGMSYNKGNGFTTRRGFGQPDKEAGFQPPELDAKTELGVEAGLRFSPTLSLYGLLKLGLHTNVGLKLSTEHHMLGNTLLSVVDKEGYYQGACIKLTPAFTISPFAASLGGLFTHTFNDLASIEFDPIWEGYFLPKAKGLGQFHYTMTTARQSEFYVANFKPWVIDEKKAAIENYTYDIYLKGNMIVDVGIAFDIYEREGRTYKIGTESYTNKEGTQALIDAGLAEYAYYPNVTMDHVVYPENTGERRLVQTIEIGTFSGVPDGDDFVRMQGTLDYAFKNGIPYEMDLVIYLKKFPNIRIVYDQSSAYCSWPYMSNGELWPELPEEE